MTDLKTLINKLAEVADLAATVLPQASLAGGAMRIGSKLIDIVDDLKHHAPDAETSDQLEEAHKKLTAMVTAKSQATSDRLRGEE